MASRVQVPHVIRRAKHKAHLLRTIEFALAQNLHRAQRQAHQGQHAHEGAFQVNGEWVQAFHHQTTRESKGDCPDGHVNLGQNPCHHLDLGSTPQCIFARTVPKNS